jgi:hypothetical protein
MREVSCLLLYLLPASSAASFGKGTVVVGGGKMSSGKRNFPARPSRYYICTT